MQKAWDGAYGLRNRAAAVKG